MVDKETDEERYRREYEIPAREAEERMKARMAEVQQPPPHPLATLTPEELTELQRKALLAAVASKLLTGALDAVTEAAKWGLVALVVAPIVRKARR